MADPAAPGLETFSDTQIEDGRVLFAQACEFVAGAMSLEQLPPLGLPEVAFAGRSNVGKSSLLNALTNRKALARTSHTPGRTQQLNFFDLGGRLMLVDMPGHGYARASKTDIARWTAVIDAYLKGRATLRRLCLLIDSRHGLKPVDTDLMDMLDVAGVSYQLVLTKVDKAKELEKVRAGCAANIAKRAAALPGIFETSAHKGRGIAELRAALAQLAA